MHEIKLRAFTKERDMPIRFVSWMVFRKLDSDPQVDIYN